MPGPAESLNSPFEQVEHAAGEFDHLDAALDVALGIGNAPCRVQRRAAAASESISFWISSRNLNITRARRCGLVAAQPGCAASALAMAASTSAFGRERHLGLHLAGARD